jgi:hypothetical protein
MLTHSPTILQLLDIVEIAWDVTLFIFGKGGRCLYSITAPASR